MLVSKRPWTSWQEIQEAHHVYMASPGPWSLEAAVDYLHDEHPQSFSSSAAQIAALMAGALDTTVLQPELLWRLRRLGSSVCGNGARILSQAVKELASHPKGTRAIVSIRADGGGGTVALLQA